MNLTIEEKKSPASVGSGTSSKSSSVQPTVPPPAPVSQSVMTRTRCPHCMKLFAIETSALEMLTAAGVRRAEFKCTGDTCQGVFAIALPLDPDLERLAMVPSIPLRESTPIPEPMTEPAPIEPSQSAAIAAPLKKTVEERECARCGATNPVASLDCVRCGIVFERSVTGSAGRGGLDLEFRVEEELALGGSRELAQLWDLVIEDYEDRIRHERFLNACRDSEALSYAAKKYSQILVAAPQDEIARFMRNKIVALISIKAESSRIPFQLGFRIPKFNTLILLLGSILFVAGILMPQVKNMMEIGLSSILLALGISFALRERT